MWRSLKEGQRLLNKPSRLNRGLAFVEQRKGLDLSDTVKDGARLVFVDPGLRRQLLMAFTEDSRLHVREVADLYRLVQSELQPTQMVQSLVRGETTHSFFGVLDSASLQCCYLMMSRCFVVTT